MSIEEVTDLEQSKYLQQEFFEKHPKLKPDNFNLGYYDDRLHFCLKKRNFATQSGTVYKVCDPETFSVRVTHCRYIVPAYFLSQLEALLPSIVVFEGKDCEINNGIWYEDQKRTPFWKYLYRNTMTPDKIAIYKNSLTSDPFHNIISLLKVLDKKGGFDV